MRLYWQQREGRQKLLLFCNGWGMDEHPFLPLASREYDVALLSDYRQLPESDELVQAVETYSERILMGWSMGVWGGQQIFAEHQGLFERTIAVNGTLCPVHDRYGIPKELFAGTISNWSEFTRRKFYHRLAGSRGVEQVFLRFQPKRSLVDQQQELEYYLHNTGCIKRENSIFHEVVISSQDRIVPTINQMAYWGDGAVSLNGGHFPFYHWQCWDELLKHIRQLP